MEDAVAITAWKFIVPTCRRHGTYPPIVIKSVLEELDRKQKTTTDKGKLSKAKSALKLYNDMKDNDFITLVGNENDGGFADHVFVYQFTRLRIKYPLVLFTQDRKLAKDILSINNHSSVNGAKRIKAFRVDTDGTPVRWKLSDKHPSGVCHGRHFDSLDGFKKNEHLFSMKANMPYVGSGVNRTSLGRPNVSSPRPFELKKRAIRLDKTPIDTRMPAIGDTVKNSDGQSLQLTNSLGTGGEGTVFETEDPQLVCKIYHKNRLNRSAIAKLELMASRTIHHRTICWPVSVAHNVDDEGVGYIMPRANGKELRRSVYIKELLIQSFPHWTRAHVVKLTSTILNAIAYLHKMNVLLCDINPGNILVQDESTVYFVDCDSYQIEGFSCPVGMAPYLAPELYGKKLHSTLRTTEHENFAIATLVFMLLHPGKPPYSYQGGGDPLKNVQNNHFPYPRGSQRSQNPPDGPWRYMFSHLPRYMKDAFHEVFTDGERKSVDEWNALIGRYMNDLGKGYVSDDLYPRTFKQLTEEQAKDKGIPWRNCNRCGKGFPSKKEEHDTCPNCFSRMRRNTRDTQPAQSAQSEEPTLAEDLWDALRSLF